MSYFANCSRDFRCPRLLKLANNIGDVKISDRTSHGGLAFSRTILFVLYFWRGRRQGDNMLRKTPIVRLVVLSALFLVAIFLGAQKSETVNGVRIIHNEKGGQWGANPAVKIELIRTIGGLDAEENLSFNNPNDIVQDSAGNLYILDTKNNRIQKLNSDGKYIKTIGRKGQGPGEFQAPYWMDIDSKDNLFIIDTRNRRIEVLSNEGIPLNTIRLRDLSLGQIRLLKPGLIVRGGLFDSRIIRGEVKKLPKLLEVIDQNGRTKFDLGEATDYKDGILNHFANYFKFDIDSGKNIILSFEVKNWIEKYNQDGKLLWRADRPLNYGTDVIEKGFVNNRGTQGPKMNRVSSGIAADGKGRIWVITLNRQLTKEELGTGSSEVTTDSGVVARTNPSQPRVVKGDVYKLEIFSPEGALLGEIPLAHYAHGIRIFGDNLFILEFYNTIFYQYKIIENANH
jgi:hypothetical protein